MRLTQGLAIVAGLALLFLAWPAALGGATSYIVVSGVSMEPMMSSGDLAIVRRASAYEVGDVIAFATEDGDVIHRIVDGSAQEGYVTQGDNVDRVDPYRPRPAQIRGREVAHVPAIGAWGLRLVRQVPAPLLAAGAIVLAIGGTDRRRRRRRPGGSRTPELTTPVRGGEPVTHEPDTDPSTAPPTTPLQRPRVRAAAACVVVAVVVLPSAFIAWRTPLTVEVAADDAPVRHELAVTVTGLADAAADLYPGGRSAPITAGPDGQAAGTTTPLLRGIVDELLVAVSHHVEGAADVAGRGRIDVTLVTGTGFEIPLEGLGPTDFSDGFSGEVLVDLDAVDRRFADYLAAARLDADTMSVRVVPVVVTDDVTVTGGPVVLDPTGDVVEVTGTMRTTVTPDGATTMVSGRAALVGLPLPVTAVRWLGTLLVLGLLAAAGVLLRRELRERPELRIGLLHGSLLVDVTPETTVGGEVVRVVSISELARLARRDQRPILHQQRADGSHHYLVPDGELTYEFVVDPAADGGAADDGGADAATVTDLDDLAVVPTFGDEALDELPMTPADLPSGRVVVVEDFAALTRIWMRDNPAPGRMQRRRLPSGRTRFSVVRNGREFVYETGPADRAGTSGRS